MTGLLSDFERDFLSPSFFTNTQTPDYFDVSGPPDRHVPR